MPESSPSDPSMYVATPDRLLRERVVDVVREAILKGRFQPGQRLVDRELAELTGVSRTSLREAMRQLEAEGLVEKRSRGGLQVSVLSAEDVRNLFDVRAVLEPAAVELFMRTATAEELRTLVAWRSESNDTEQALDDLHAFYDHLLSGTRNPVLEQMFSLMMARLNVMRRVSLQSGGRLDRSRGEILAMLAAMAAGDAPAATELARVHVENARSAALQVLAESS